MDGFQPFVAISLALAAIVFLTIIIRNSRQTFVTNSRIYRMMLSCGIDEESARLADRRLDLDMEDVRRRCRSCPDPEACDRWLRGEAVPSNSFCPNAARFSAVVEARRSRLLYHPARHPGRRLDY